MKNKIMMLVLLCALLVGLVPPSSARAGMVSIPDFPVEVPYEYFYIKYNGYGSSDLILVGSDVPFTFDGNNVVNVHEDFLCNMWKCASGTDYWNTKYSSAILEFISTPLDLLLCSNHDILDTSGSVVFAENYRETYDFKEWCFDAGLSCVVSENETDDIYPFVYNSSYDYIVRKVDSEEYGFSYLLTQVKFPADALCYLTYYEENGIGYFGLASVSSNEEVVAVKRYGYDLDGSGWLLIDEVNTYGVSMGFPISSISVNVTKENALIYNSCDVFSHDLEKEVVHFSTSEYNETGYRPVVVPSVTPVPSPDVGSDVYIYKPSLSGKVNADSVNMRELPSVDSVVVASFIKTWSLSVQGYCYDKDGVIWYLCTTERDGVAYTGYMQAKYIKVESYGGIDVNFEGIDVEDIPGVLDTAKDSLLSALDLISVVPLMMGAVFGFLPSWCLLMVGVTFVIVCIVGIIKVFRG